ncbi:CoA-acylating methylmalonate-semialdehyde dehydrogenase [Shewanella surugensis]|uniref:CoA-acylating methylmalonate-semialdehyde dehydrogenase n=1 Tax=Shewanella surugensis TaxID=212020 RepID=A0ABT0LIN4_9GAMM|nr:CoA-acylating methylmalonate-semialdehyde dehydrogenase [Shewanella surugensis]MCL1127320.1 CoA-acylating methylmalonate-semialdehyde dehydrogenase [Shewanella surugensis]
MTTLIPHFINGQINEEHQALFDVYNPATGQSDKQVVLGSSETLDKAVSAAKLAFPAWANTSPLKRSRIMNKFVILLEENKDELAKIITNEHGKVHADALGEVQRGLEVAEYACSAPELLKGDFSSNVGGQVDCHTLRLPVGICAGITPFNFPCMVPMWMFPIAIVAGNAFILKPAEKDPSAAIFMAKLLKKSGLPAGIFNVVHGDKLVVDAILEHHDIGAVSFVGSTPIAKYIYEAAAKNGKRVQALGGANNHCVVMPDADLDLAVHGIIGGAFGSAGERCMALPVAVVVGKDTHKKLIEKLSIEIDKLNVNSGDQPNVDMGPLVTKEHQQKVLNYIDIGVKEGATLVRDGRNTKVPGYENGYFVGATLFDNVKSDMVIYKEEIFGPVLCVLAADNLGDAIELINSGPFGNGSCIYTTNGAHSRTYTTQVHAGMIGVNIPIPVPMAFHSFGGWKASLFGDTHVHGPEGFKFYTRLKTISTRWGQSDNTASAFVMPTLS